MSPVQDSDGKVLVVDDESDMLLLYETYLSETFDVVTTTSGPKALQMIDDSVDIVILDRKMPEMTGDEVLGILREEGLDVQVGMVTAMQPTDELLNLPFDGYLSKPVDKGDILGLVNTLLVRQEFHAASQRFFRLAARKTALEEVGEHHTSEYREVLDQLQGLQAEIDSILGDVSTERPYK